MSIDPKLELAQFKHFIVQHVESGNAISPEEALDLWRLQNPRSEEFANDVLALRAAIADLEAGDIGVPLDEFDREFRRQHGLSPSE
jgi:hypothetical protein